MIICYTKLKYNPVNLAIFYILKNLVHKIISRTVVLRENNSKIVIFLFKNLVISSKFTTFAAEINKIDV